MHVVLAVNGTYMYYGLPKYFYFLGKHLRENGVDVTFILDSMKGMNRLMEVDRFAKFRILNVPTRNYLSTALFSYRLARLLDTMDFDILHTGHVNPYFYLRRWPRKPVVFQPFGNELFSLEPFLTGITKLRYRMGQPVLRFCGQKCDVLLAEGDFQIKDMMHWYRVPEDKLDVLPVGIDLDFIRGQATVRKDRIDQADDHPVLQHTRYPLPRKRFTLLCVSSLHKWENVDWALKAFAYCVKNYYWESGVGREVRFVLIGSGPERENLRALVKQLGIEGIFTHLENVPEHELYNHYADADALICPTVEQDEQMSILEALAFGLPVISTGQEWIVKPETEGYISPLRLGVQHMAGSIDAVFHTYRDKTLQRATPALDKYDFKNIAPVAIDIYKKVLGK